MEIGIVIPGQAVPAERIYENSPKSQGNMPGLFGSVSVVYERTEITAEYSLYTRDGNAGNSAVIQPAITNGELSAAEIAGLREAIHAEVLAQVKYFLGVFFEENPEAVEQVSRGEIPEYYNVENTACRILDIYFAYYEEGQERTAFVERAKSIIQQAYADVEGMVGTLPDIVQETREKVMEILDNFANGRDISEFMQRQIQ